MTTKYMPAHGEHAAPSFNKTKPHELGQFFQELERAFMRIGMTNDVEMKDEVLFFVDFDVEQVWKLLPEYADATKTYQDFKDAILVHYPDATSMCVYTLCDMEALCDARKASGINSTDDLQIFHIKFLAITQYLMKKTLIGEAEQRRAYVKAFPLLLAAVRSRLKIHYQAQEAGVLHHIEHVLKAAHHILNDGDKTLLVPMPSAPIVPVAVRPAPVTNAPVKVEMFSSVMADFTKTIVAALQGGN